MDNKFMKSILRGFASLLLLALLTSFMPGDVLSALAAPGDITRVSVDSSGAQANGISYGSTISNDGRFVAFRSAANNLVSGDTNGAEDIFVHDRQTGATNLISVATSGEQGNYHSDTPRISGNGRYVTFSSRASNLIPDDSNYQAWDVFVHDRQTGVTTCVSVNSDAEQANNISFNSSISSEGRYVAFESEASNLVTEDTNGAWDVFVHDTQTGETIRVSVSSNGAQANGNSNMPDISADGRYVVFSSSASNLVGDDTNNASDVFVHDLQTGETKRVSVASNATQADSGGGSPAISGNGRYVVFGSDATNLVSGDKLGLSHIYVHDFQTGETTRVSVNSDGSQMIGRSSGGSISADGRYVAFSYADTDNYSPALFEIYVHDRQTGVTTFASTNLSGGHGASDQDASYAPDISTDGRFVTFTSYASNLVNGDTNSVTDIFVKEMGSSPTNPGPTVVSITPFGGVVAASRLYFIITFSENVTGVNLDDFVLTTNGNINGATKVSVGGSGNTYSVEVNTGTGDGNLRLDLMDDDSIVDDALNPLGGVGTGNGNFNVEDWTTIDKTAPVVTGSLRADPNPTAAESVRFTVNFSEDVYLVDSTDFTLVTTGSISGASVGEISGGGSTYTIDVNTGTGDGTLRLDVVDYDDINTIRDAATNPLGGPGAGNGDFTTGEAYTIAKSAPSAPSVTSSLRADPNPTLADLVSFTVTFSEAVSGVDPDDFTVTAFGNLTGAFVANASGAGNTYSVIVATGNGDGSLRLDVFDNDSIQNASGIPLGGVGSGNGNFTTGESYTVDKSAPYVTGSLRTDPNPTQADSVSFMVGFSEAVTGVDVNDFSLSTAGNISGAGITGISGSGYMYTVSVNTGSGYGTIRLDVVDNDSIIDASGYPLGGPGVGNGNFVAGEEYAMDRPIKNLIVETLRSNGNNDGWILESSEDSEQGGHKDSNSATFVLGDDAQNRQFRSILHIPTHYIPNNAVITKALVMIKGEALVGTNPFDTHQNIQVDIRSGAFGFIGPFPYRGLQVSDFQSPAHRDAVGFIENNPYNGWYWAWLDSSAFEYINRYGITQIRLRFQLDDNNDLANNYLRFFSGDHTELENRPRLVIEYYTP